MNVRLITQNEIIERQQSVRTGYRRTQQGFSITGIRQLMGSSFIAMGQKIYGRCEERRESIAQAAPLKPARGI